MTSLNRRRFIVVTSVLLALAGSAALVRSHLDELHAAFETDARIVHRLLSQRASQHDAIMATLSLLASAPDNPDALRRLPAVYPQILRLETTTMPNAWDDPATNQAESRSRDIRRAELAGLDTERGRYVLLQATSSGSFAAHIDIRTMVPWSEWPMRPETSTVRVVLALGERSVMLQPGMPLPGLGTFNFRKRLAADSQPFDVVLDRTVVGSDLPWPTLGAWLAVVLAAALTALALARQQERRRRAEELLRLGQVARLSTLGELAAGMAHELNQPLAALSAGTQAARRLIDEDPPELDTAREAMARAVEQARRAADVLARLRRLVERPGDPSQHQSLDFGKVVRDVLNLLEPELQRHAVRCRLETSAVAVIADPIALEQIVHNLVMNAIQALGTMPTDKRSIEVSVVQIADEGVLTIADSGPGIPAEALPRLFEPFYTTRAGGLGLGLTLCESLAVGMNGRLAARNLDTGGAAFELRLPASKHP